MISLLFSSFATANIQLETCKSRSLDKKLTKDEHEDKSAFEAKKFENYFDFHIPVKYVKPHQVMITLHSIPSLIKWVFYYFSSTFPLILRYVFLYYGTCIPKPFSFCWIGLSHQSWWESEDTECETDSAWPFKVHHWERSQQEIYAPSVERESKKHCQRSDSRCLHQTHSAADAASDQVRGNKQPIWYHLWRWVQIDL